MTEWLEVMTVAFGAQLAVLPGEKVQFIIAGLSTRYNPYLIVAAAGSAFAGWTVLEILLGNVLRGALPELYLNLITAGLFLFFAGMLYRSAPTEEVSAARQDNRPIRFGERVTEALGVALPKSVVTFLGIFAMMAVGEVGDKTQLVTISLAVQYGATSAIWVGEMLAILPVSLVNALFFRRFAHKVNLRTAHYVASGVFAFFGLDLLLSVVTGHSVWEAVVSAVSGILAVGGIALP
jgi:putative Ca2+/H+ antiporter (TMEM165/GDT1 family)